MTFGGVIPGGAIRKIVAVTEDICAMAAPISVPGSKYTRMRPTPGIEFDSMREMPLTVVENARSLMSTTRRSISSAGNPGYAQTTATTGMSIVGKMSTAVRVKDSTPITRMRTDMTATV